MSSYITPTPHAAGLVCGHCSSARARGFCLLSCFYQRNSTSLDRADAFLCVLNMRSCLICGDQTKTASQRVAGCLSLYAKTAITNCHKLGGLTSWEIIFSPFWEPDVQDQGVSQQGHVPSKGSFLASGSSWWRWHSLACGYVTAVSV